MVEIAGGHLKNFELIEEGKKLVKITKQSEIDFYDEIYQNQTNQVIQSLKNFIPTYYGKLEGSRVILENLLYGFKNPCIMDIKLGALTYTPDEPNQKKREWQDSKLDKTTSGKLGYRISGMCIRDLQGEVVSKWNKRQGGGYFEITPENVHLKFEQILTVGSSISKQAAQYYLEQLEQLYQWFCNNEQVQFFGSSVLFINDNVLENQKYSLKFIDLAHPWKSSAKDQNVMQGLENIILEIKKHV